MKLPEVEQARQLMTEAIDWSVMKWLSEKKRVRRAADKANDSLDAAETTLQSNWPAALQQAYKSGKGSPDILRLARKLRDSHDAALKVRADAEDIFDRAEKRLSTALAREGCQRAIEGWDLHLSTIRLFEEASRH